VENLRHLDLVQCPFPWMIVPWLPMFQHCHRFKILVFLMEFENMFLPMPPLRLSPYNKQVLVIRICLPQGCFGSLATFYWWRPRGNTYLETQIPINNQTTSRVELCSSDLLGVLAMDCFLEAIINCLESPHQTNKSPSHRFGSLAKGSLLPNI